MISSSFWTWRCLFALIAAGMLAAPGVIAAADLHGLPIAGIVYQFSGQLPDPDLKRLVSMRPGDFFSRREIRKAMETFHREGLARDVVVDAKEEEGGVILTFTLIPPALVSAVSVEGNHALSSRKVKKTLLLQEGEEFTPKKVKESVDALTTRYREEGYVTARVSISDTPDGKHRRVRVKVDEGPRAVVERLFFSGETVLPAKELEGALLLRPGGPFRNKLLEKSTQAIKKLYSGKGYVAAEIGEPIVRPGQDGMSVSVEIPVSANDRLEVAFDGNRSYSEKALMKLLPFAESRDLSEGGVDEARDDILRFYRSNGYYFARVSTGIVQETGLFSVRFLVAEGEKVHIASLILTGNKALTGEDLRSVMDLEEKGWFQKGVFTDEALESDIGAIVSLYADHGYLGASVAHREVRFDGNAVHVTLSIDEGVPTNVAGITIKGNQEIEPSELRDSMRTQPGGPYSERSVREDRYHILSLYGNRGYIYADVRVEERFSDDRREVELVYSIAEDQPVTVGRVMVTGLKRVRPKVVKREITVGEGETYSIDRVLRDQSRVYKTGLFSSVKFEPAATEEREYVKDLVMKVKEKNAGAVEVGIGYGDEERFRAVFDISHKNLWGLGRYLGVRGEISAIESKYTVNFKEPYLFNKEYDFRATAVKQRIERKEYDLDVVGLTAGIEKELTENLRASLLYQFEEADVLSVKPGAVLRDEDTGRITIGSVIPSVMWDSRDNPLDPTKGFLHGVTYKLATEATGSEINFYKLTGQSSWYYTPWGRSTFVISGRLGIGETFSGDAQLPISERFFIGGRTTVRGYSLDTLGPKGSDGSPTGGNAMIIINAEARFLLYKDMAGAVFVDSGNVWQSLSDMDVTGLKKTAGLGILYRTPVGPLRLDYAVKLDRRRGESASEWHFTLGYSF